jgi:hypothetical protein
VGDLKKYHKIKQPSARVQVSTVVIVAKIREAVIKTKKLRLRVQSYFRGAK